MVEFLRKYWDDIYDLIEKIYEAIKAALIKADEE